jgi:poly(3-hydroxybutyrate) depolymerase
MLKAGNSSASLMVGGVKRDYLLHVPSSYTGKSPVPLLLDFHPLLSNASSHRGSSGYDGVADKEGFIVAYPDGPNSWNVGPCCTKSRTVDDGGFAKALVAKLGGEACIDTKRVYASGYSNGGGMAHYLACNAADIFAAVAPAAFDLLVEAEEPCHPVRPISVLSFRSTNDSIVPYGGGASDPPTALLGYSLNTIHFLGAKGTFMHWAELDMCTDTPMDTGNGCQTYKQCAAGTEVTLCTSSSAGHATGPAAQGWAFLKRFTLP